MKLPLQSSAKGVPGAKAYSGVFSQNWSIKLGIQDLTSSQVKLRKKKKKEYDFEK